MHLLLLKIYKKNPYLSVLHSQKNLYNNALVEYIDNMIRSYCVVIIYRQK